VKSLLKSNSALSSLSHGENLGRTSSLTPKTLAFAEWPWIVITLLAFLVRLHVALSVPLLGAEAYYWDWSQHLAWGYYDHPPMIAWLIYLTCALFGKTVLGVRLVPLLLGTALPAITRWLAGSLYGAGAGRIAALAMATAPLVVVGGVVSTPDMVVSVFYLLALALGLHSARTWSAVAFFLTGVVTALAILSKFNGFILIPILVLYWLVKSLEKSGRAKWVPLAAVLGLAVLIPYLHWNATHDWVTFRYLFWYRHKEAGQVLINWKGPFELLADFFSLGPILGILVLAAAYVTIRSSGGMRNTEHKLAELTMFVLPLAGFLILSFKILLAPHWVGQVLLVGVIVAAGTWCRWQESDATTPWRRGYRTLLLSVVVNVIICLVLYGAVLNASAVYRLGRTLGMPSFYDDVKEFYGWNEFGQELNRQFRELEKEGKPVFILAPEHRLASLARFYAAGSPNAAVLGGSDEHQFAFWPKPAQTPHSNAVYVDKKLHASRVDTLYERYNSVSPLNVLSVKIFNGFERKFFFWQLRDKKVEEALP
jgi:4-amino-4-deoxy-L-arabinose transferase-like glycosyltransferase